MYTGPFRSDSSRIMAAEKIVFLRVRAFAVLLKANLWQLENQTNNSIKRCWSCTWKPPLTYESHSAHFPTHINTTNIISRHLGATPSAINTWRGQVMQSDRLIFTRGNSSLKPGRLFTLFGRQSAGNKGNVFIILFLCRNDYSILLFFLCSSVRTVHNFLIYSTHRSEEHGTQFSHKYLDNEYCCRTIMSVIVVLALFASPDIRPIGDAR